MINIDSLIESVPTWDRSLLIERIFSLPCVKSQALIDAIIEIEEETVSDSLEETSDEEIFNNYLDMTGDSFDVFEYIRDQRELEY